MPITNTRPDCDWPANMACFSRSLGHWPKDGLAALAEMAEDPLETRLFCLHCSITSLVIKPYEALVTRGEEEVVVMH